MGDDKQNVKYEAKTTLDDAVTRLEELVEGLRSREVLLRSRSDALRLHPGTIVSMALEGKQKGSKESIEIELSWRSEAGNDAIDDLAIGKADGE